MAYSPFDAVDKSGDRGAAVHAAALMWSLGIVVDEVLVEGALHFLDGLEPGAAALDAEMLVKQGAVPAFDNAV